MSEHVVPPQLEAIMPKTKPVDFSTPYDTSNLKGRSVLVTGGASGLGLAYMTAMAEAGALVTFADVQEQLAVNVAEELSSKGLKVNYFPGDVRSYQSQLDIFQTAIRYGGGKIDIVVPNAGIVAEKNLNHMIPQEKPTLESPPPPEPTTNGMDVNLLGVYYSCYLALHYFRLPREQDDTFTKAIVLISSLAGYTGYPHSTTYSMSKFGVRGIFYGIREAAGKQDPPVRVNLVSPEFVKTGMTQNPKFSDSEAGMLTKIMGFVPIEAVVEAMVRVSGDERVGGRSVLAMSNGNIDAGDNIWEGYGGIVMQREMAAVMSVALERIKAMQAQAGSRNENL